MGTEQSLRLAVFLGVLVLMMAAEFLWPRRDQAVSRQKRWPHNLTLVVLDIVLVRLVFPVSLAGFCLIAAQKGWGIFNTLDVPFWLTFSLSLLALDILIYGQHIMLHKIPILWRLHRVHHTDTEFDVTTALRFHPIEILLSMLVKFTAAAILGAPPEAALAFEIILNAAAMFNHGNVNIPTRLDEWLRRFIVTPDMHRVHHSTIRRETDSNYGFSISLWDRLFGTYHAQPQKGHGGMIIGLNIFRKEEDMRVEKLLLQPFKRDR